MAAGSPASLDPSLSFPTLYLHTSHLVPSWNRLLSKHWLPTVYQACAEVLWCRDSLPAFRELQIRRQTRKRSLGIKHCEKCLTALKL